MAHSRYQQTEGMPSRALPSFRTSLPAFKLGCALDILSAFRLMIRDAHHCVRLQILRRLEIDFISCAMTMTEADDWAFLGTFKAVRKLTLSSLHVMSNALIAMLLTLPKS